MSPAVYPTKCSRCAALLPVADGRTLCPVCSMAEALYTANQTYRGNEFNLFAYWRHLATAAIGAKATRP